MHLRKCAAEEDCVGTNKQSCLQEDGYVDIDCCIHFGELFEASPRTSSASQREESSVLLPQLLMGGEKESMLNPVLSLALVNDLVNCVQSIPCATSPLLSMLRLLGQWT